MPLSSSVPRFRPGSRVVVAAILGLCVVVSPIAAQTEQADLAAVHLIKTEAQQHSKVMEYASYLTDVYGPRLTNSPQMRAAADYARRQFTEIGLTNPRFETWGTFGRGWANERTAVHVLEPSPWPVLAIPKAWTPGTDGVVAGEVTHVTLEDEADLEKQRGNLAGKIVLLSALRQVEPLFEAPGRRYTESDLKELATERPAAARPRGGRGNGDARVRFREKRMAFLKEEGALAILTMSSGSRGDSGSLLVQAPAAGEGSRDPKDAPVLPQLVVSAEHYGRMVRTLEKGLRVSMELDVRNQFFDADQEAFNILADLPGTDLADEVVLIGAHFDSWHAGTGATDNGGGSAVVMEAMRILRAIGLPMRRTVRAALWTGEEQGLLGSRAYVKEHFADPDTMVTKPDHATLAAYFNVDNGGGAFRGIYQQRNEMVAPIFASWIDPLRSLGISTSSIRSTNSTDHVSFDEVGLPGFQFVQAPWSTGRALITRIWIVQDERLISEDLIKNAIIMASFAYHAATRAEMLPRKPLPSPPPHSENAPVETAE